MSLAKPSMPELSELQATEDVMIPPYDLESDEPELESDWHREQIELLLACLKAWWSGRTDFYATGNLTIYFSPEQIKSRDFRGPDFFVVLGVDPKPRKSWVLWAEEGKYPNVIVEILSDSTAEVDRKLKKQLYQDTFRTPEYFWFDPFTLEFRGFLLVGGKYQPITPNAQGWLFSQQLELYLGIYNEKLRFFTPDGQLVPTPGESLAETQQRATQAEEKAQRLAKKLRELGIDPAELQ